MKTDASLAASAAPAPKGGAVSQFKKPRGLLGRLVGWVLANRPQNVQRNKWTVDLIDVAPADRVLEIGCGPGVALALCLARASKGAVVGLDHSQVMIAQAAKRNARAVRAKRLTLIAGTLADLPAAMPPFDKIFSINVIQFVDQAAFLSASLQHLAPGGTLAVTYQPRGKTASPDQALAAAKGLEAAMTALSLKNVRTEILNLKPVPAVCVLGSR